MRLLFPAMLAVVTGASIVLAQCGLPLPLVSAGVTLFAIAMVMLLERLTPLHRRWNARPEALDLVLLVGNRAVDIAVVGGTVALLARLEAAGVATSRLHLWPRHAPLLLQAALGITLAELVRYWLHRLSHRPGLLWRWHRTHHQPRRMYALNGPRLHPGNYLWVTAATALPMLLLGAGLPSVVVAANVTTFFVLFQHANVDLPLAGWNRVFATPDVHRIHHARRHADGRNYAIVLVAIDRLFGSYLPAEKTGADDIGLAG